MDPESIDMRVMAQWLKKLEMQNRRLMQAGVMALVLLSSLVLMGQAPRKLRPVESDRFTLKDATGKKRAELMMEEAGPGLVLYDETGRQRVGKVRPPSRTVHVEFGRAEVGAPAITSRVVWERLQAQSRRHARWWRLCAVRASAAWRCRDHAADAGGTGGWEHPVRKRQASSAEHALG